MIYYEKKITNPDYEWLVLFHGIGGSTNTWKYQMDAFLKEYNLFLFDFDGHGKSDIDKNKTKYKPAQMAKTLHSILKKEKIGRVNLVAFSLGTAVALEYVRQYPAHVDKMILSGCIINIDFKKKMLCAATICMGKVLPLKLSYSISAKILLPKKKHKKSREYFIREAMKMHKITFTTWLHGLGGTKKQIREYVSTINEHLIPVFFIMGNEDYMFLKGVRKLKEMINHSKLHIIDHCGHGCIIEKRDIYNELVLEYLSNYPGEKA